MTDLKNIYDSYLVSETYAIDNLVDGTLYLVCSAVDDLGEALSQARENLLTEMDDNQLVYDYEIKVLDNPAEIIPEGQVLDAINSGANVVLPIFTPNTSEKQYLVITMQSDTLEMYLPSLIMKAEYITKTAIEDALFKLASLEPNSCKEILSKFILQDEESIEAPEFYLDGVAYSIADADDEMAMAPSKKGVTGCITFQESRKIFERFVDNCKIVKKANENAEYAVKCSEKVKIAKMEMDHVFYTVWGINKNKESLRYLFFKLRTKDLKESYTKNLDREYMAQNSELLVSIEASEEGIAKSCKNDGRFRVYISKDGKKELVHFKHKQSCIVYMIYLLDKVRYGDKVDTLKIKNYRQLFCDLYTSVYGQGIEVIDKESQQAISKSVFNALFEPNTKDTKRKVSLSDCYGDIHKQVEEKIELFGESSLPFYIPNENSHLTIAREKISIPQSLIALANKNQH